MKLRELIEELEKIASDYPEAEVKFELVDMATELFEPQNQYFIAALPDGLGDCMLSIGPSESLRPDFLRFAERRADQRNR